MIMTIQFDIIDLRTVEQTACSVMVNQCICYAAWALLVLIGKK